MKIYFAGSIRGGREDADLYAELIGFLKDFGQVLTEHVGDVNFPCCGDEIASDRSIHDRDIDWLLVSDVMIAEVTVASMGVGYEIGRAVSAGKKIICLYRKKPDRKLSAMISGCPQIYLITYDNISEVKKKLRTCLKVLQPGISIKQKFKDDLLA
ncbi:MAG: nucleoside 2-deoxyribosyltransferase [Bacteroidota bacterium]